MVIDAEAAEGRSGSTPEYSELYLVMNSDPQKLLTDLGVDAAEAIGVDGVSVASGLRNADSEVPQCAAVSAMDAEVVAAVMLDDVNSPQDCTDALVAALPAIFQSLDAAAN